jgi:hypothetical protein
MKRNLPSEEHPKFQGNMRHYHHSTPRARSTWDAWIEGDSAKVRSSRNWLKILGVLIGVLVLAAIITGLIIELG